MIPALGRRQRFAEKAELMIAHSSEMRKSLLVDYDVLDPAEAFPEAVVSCSPSVSSWFLPFRSQRRASRRELPSSLPGM
jgi:hypothetical protein